jgi:hypothetical protein
MIYRLNKKISDDGEIRTPIPKAALPPQSSVSTNFTTSPKRLAKLPNIYLLANKSDNSIIIHRNGIRTQRKTHQKIT